MSITQEEYYAVVAAIGDPPPKPESWHSTSGQRRTAWDKWVQRANAELRRLRGTG